MFLFQQNPVKISPIPVPFPPPKIPSPTPKIPSTSISPQCDHNIIKDWIDLDPDRGKTIYYCDKCLSTFTKQGETYTLQYVNEGPPSYQLPM